MSSKGMHEAMRKIQEEFDASNARLDKVFEECYVVEPSPRYPTGCRAGAGGAKTGLMHDMRAVSELERGIVAIAGDLPSDASSEAEEAVEKLCDEFLTLLASFEKNAEAKLRR